MKYIEPFLSHLHVVGYARSTIEGYRYLLRDLERFLKDEKQTDIRSSREDHVLSYLKSTERGRSGATNFNVVCKLKTFYRYLVDEGHIFYSPIETYRVPKLRSISRVVLTELAMETMLELLRTDTPLHLRSKAILELAYSSALRSCEIRRLRIEHIDNAANTLLIERSKNRKERIVPVGRSALDWVGKYVQEARPRFLHGAQHSCVFISHRGGNPLCASGFWRGIELTLSESGCDKIPPHAIRASCATALLENGMHVGFIAELLGHTELSTTQVYLRMHERTLHEEIGRRHPREHMHIEGE